MEGVGFKPLDIRSQEDLETVLKEYPDIHPEKWVKGASNLYHEIKNGECVLGIEDGKLTRRVDVIRVKCFHTDQEGQRYEIVEDKQLFKSGKVRERGYHFIAEKLQAGETPEQCAKRGLEEELQISGPDVHVQSLSEEDIVEKKLSPTYLGIQSVYNTYIFSCEVDESHYKAEYKEEQSDKTTIFKWVKI